MKTLIDGVTIIQENATKSVTYYDCQDGILVDHQLRTNNPAILALGNCARFPSQRYGRRLRLESIQNAIDGAAIVAAAISGQSPGYDPSPIISII